MRRIVRFYPLYLLGFGLGMVREILLIVSHNSFAFSPGLLITSLALGLAFLPFPAEQRGFSLYSSNVPAWSLAYELAINVAYALCIRFITSVSLCVLLILSGLGLAFAVGHHGSADMGASLLDWQGTLCRTIFSFSFGVLIRRSTWMRLNSVPVVAVLVLTAALLMVPRSFGWAYDLLFIGILSPLLVSAGCAREPGPLLHRWAVRLGVISFPLYAIHWPLVQLALAASKTLHIAGWMIGAVLLLVLIAAGALLDASYDRPAQSLLRRAMGRKAKTPTLVDENAAVTPGEA